ncbi:hypothetical protein D3C71_1363820 [compost metagenome]
MAYTIRLVEMHKSNRRFLLFYDIHGGTQSRFIIILSVNDLLHDFVVDQIAYTRPTMYHSKLRLGIFAGNSIK